MMRPALLLMGVGLLFCSGCRSHVVRVNLVNAGQQPVKTIIVDYPGGTFGKDVLQPSQTFSYAIKPLDSGNLKLQFTDAAGTDHTQTGPPLRRNDEGTVEVKFSQDGAKATAALSGR